MVFRGVYFGLIASISSYFWPTGCVLDGLLVITFQFRFVFDELCVVHISGRMLDCIIFVRHANTLCVHSKCIAHHQHTFDVWITHDIPLCYTMCFSHRPTHVVRYFMLTHSYHTHLWLIMCFTHKMAVIPSNMCFSWI